MTSTGAVMDPVVDKIFVATVTVSLLVEGRLALSSALLLGARDVVELPLLVWSAFHRGLLANGSERVEANAFGKAVTVVQFLTVIAAILGQPYAAFLAVAAGALGVLAGATYWARMLRRRPPASADTPRPAEAPSRTVDEPGAGKPC